MKLFDHQIHLKYYFFPIIADCTYISPVQSEIKKLTNLKKGQYLWWYELKYLK